MADAKLLKDGDRLAGAKVYLRLVEPSDCRQVYVDWLCDPDVNQYLETRWIPQTLATVQDFVSRMRADHESYLLAIVDAPTDKHVGNIKLGPINRIHSNCDVS